MWPLSGLDLAYFQRRVVLNRTRTPRTSAKLIPRRYGRNGSPTEGAIVANE